MRMADNLYNDRIARKDIVIKREEHTGRFPVVLNREQ